MEASKLITISTDSYTLTHQIIESVRTEEYVPHIHDRWELLFVIEGDIIYEVEGRSYRLKRGDLVLTRPLIFHNIAPKGGTYYDRYNAIFPTDFIPEQILSYIPEDVDVFRFSKNGRIFDIFEKTDYYINSLPKQRAEVAVRALLLEVLCNTLIDENFKIGENDSNPLIKRALEYMDSHLTTVGSIEEICNALYITKSHLHHLFGSIMKLTPKQYIIQKRLLMAQRMIRAGRKATEACAEVGFEDYATFFRNYKRHFGYPPSKELGI